MTLLLIIWASATGHFVLGYHKICVIIFGLNLYIVSKRLLTYITMYYPIKCTSYTKINSNNTYEIEIQGIGYRTFLASVTGHVKMWTHI